MTGPAFCPNCGAPRAHDARFCATCGRPYDTGDVVVPPTATIRRRAPIFLWLGSLASLVGLAWLVLNVHGDSLGVDLIVIAIGWIVWLAVVWTVVTLVAGVFGFAGILTGRRRY